MADRPTRRERLHAATAAEIRDVARTLLTREGPAAVSLRAIAREMGMSAPALYRYYSSHEELVAALVADYAGELRSVLGTACDAVPEEDLPGRVRAVALGLRAWATASPAAFGLLFGRADPTAPGPAA